MIAYVVRRLLYVVPVVLGVAFLVWGIFDSGMFGDPAAKLLGKNPDPNQLDLLRAAMGMNDPWYVRFWEYLESLLSFDFGRSRAYKVPVVELIARGVGPSLSLTVPAFLTATVLAVSFSLFCAAFRGGALDRGILVTAVAMMSVSSLVYIIFGQYLLGYHGPFPVSGWEAGPQAVGYLVLPWIIFVLLSIGPDLRFYRTALLEEVRQDYVRTATAKGLSRNQVLFKHVLRNGLIPILTRVVVVLPFLFTGSLLLEQFFRIPGLGGITVGGVLTNDMPVIRAMTYIFALLFIVANLVTDVLYTLVDPRVRLS